MVITLYITIISEIIPRRTAAIIVAITIGTMDIRVGGTTGMTMKERINFMVHTRTWEVAMA